MFLFAAWMAVAAPTKYVLLPLECPEHVSVASCEALESALASDLRRYPNTQLLTHRDVRAVLNNDAAKSVLGCDDPSCYSNVTAAMGAPFLMRASYDTLGNSQLLSLTVIRTKDVQVTSASSLRIKGGEIDAVLDALPRLGAQAFEQLGIRSRTENVLLRLPAPTKSKIPSGFDDIPLGQSLPDTTRFLHDDAGNVIAYDPKEPSFLLAGSEGALWLQSVRTSSRRNDERLSARFWDPRFEGASFEMDNGVFHLSCGKKKIALKLFPEDVAKRMRRAARTFGLRWQRSALLLARDNRGIYYYVDRIRDQEKRTGEVEDFRLFIGRKGRIAHVPLDDAIVDQAGAVFLTAKGRLVVERQNDQKVIRWFLGEAETPLVDVDLWSAASMVYRRLGAYGDQPLGTACDPYL
ncbi:MAG: hypothetical protein AAF654_08745 [Myxococcota bacterium]